MHTRNGKRRRGVASRALLAAVLAAALCAIAAPLEGEARADEEPDAPPAADAPRTPVESSTQERLRELSRELGKLANEHGPDAVSLQVGLLTGTIRAGAVGATEVEVVGPSPEAGPEYLRYRVVTGQIFDSATSTATERLDTVWGRIAAPAFEGMETFAMEPSGIEIVFEYALQALADQPDGKPDPTGELETRTMTLRIPPKAAQDYAAGALAPDELLAAAVVTDDGPTLREPKAAKADDAG